MDSFDASPISPIFPREKASLYRECDAVHQTPLGLEELKAINKTYRDCEQLRSFAELASLYQAGVDYEVEIKRGSRNIVVAAWHGGHIERGSDQLAQLIAGELFTLYTFKGLIPTENRHPLRITSIRFDEPRLLSLAQQSEMVVSIHCCPTAGRTHRIFVGGGAPDYIKYGLISELRANDFNSGIDRLFPGMHPKNPCNMGSRLGLQLEVSQSYMDWLLLNPDYLQRLAQTISSCIVPL
jgi:phage replication-related protein YjqB (UPF0714/DUF867 family)